MIVGVGCGVVVAGADGGIDVVAYGAECDG